MTQTTNYTEDILDFTPDFLGHEAETMAEAEAAMARLTKGANGVHDKLKVAKGFLVIQAEAREAEAAGGRYSSEFNKRLKGSPLRLFPAQDRAAALWLLDPANWPDAKKVLKRLNEKDRLRAGLRGIKRSVLEDRQEVPTPKAKAKPEPKAATEAELTSAFDTGYAAGHDEAKAEAAKQRAKASDAGDNWRKAIMAAEDMRGVQEMLDAAHTAAVVAAYESCRMLDTRSEFLPKGSRSVGTAHMQNIATKRVKGFLKRAVTEAGKAWAAELAERLGIGAAKPKKAQTPKRKVVGHLPGIGPVTME
jgi:hypothetical protein